MNFSNYPGAKNNSGILQFYINRIPYHTRCFEMFGGTAILSRTKKPASIKNIVVDADSEVIAQHNKRNDTKIDYIVGDALALLKANNTPTFNYSRSDFIFLDPPYPFSSRRSGKKYYRHEMTDTDHVQLLSTVLQTDANIMICTRENELYDKMLKKWRREEFRTMGRQGVVEEIIYMNYEKPVYLHQYDYIGGDCWQRQGAKRKRKRFYNKINAMDIHEKHALIEELIKQDAAAVQHFLWQTNSHGA